MQVQDIFIAVMEIIGAITLNESPEPADMQKCLRHCNLMLKEWSADGLLQQSPTQYTFPLTPSKGSYTIGIGGDFNAARPEKIESAFIRDSDQYDQPLDLIDRRLYEAYEDKNVSFAKPDSLYYDPGVAQQANPKGAIYIYPPPDGVLLYTLFLDCWVTFTQFVNLTDQVTFTDAYHAAIVDNLAPRMWRPIGRPGQPPPDLIAQARRSKSIIEVLNTQSPVMRVDVNGKGAGNYNIYTDSYR